MRRLPYNRVFAAALVIFYCALSLIGSGVVRALSCTDPAQEPQKCIDSEDLYSVNQSSGWYDPRAQSEDQSSCTPAASPGASFADFSPDPQAVTFYNGNMKKKISDLAPLYQKAAKEENVADWEILAGIHEIEHGLSRVNVTNSFGFMTPFQMGAAEIAGAGGNPNDSRLADGHSLNDDEFVYVARLALRVLKGKAADSNVKVDLSKPLSPPEIARVTIAYNTGQGTVSALKDTSPYAWAGWNSSTFKLPTHWAGGNTYNQADPLSVPGAVTTVGMIRGSGGVDSADTSATSGGCGSAGAPATNTAPGYCKDGTATGGQKIVCYAYLFDHYDYNDPGCRGTVTQLTTFGPNGECKDIVGVKGLLEAVEACNKNDFGSDCKLPRFKAIIDCSSLVDAAIYGAFGTDMAGAATASYPSNSHLHEIQKGDAQPGDILWFVGHTEVVVTNDMAKQHFDSFGAHQPQGPDESQVGPSGYAYDKVLKVFRVVP